MAAGEERELIVEVISRVFPAPGGTAEGDFGILSGREATRRYKITLLGPKLAQVLPKTWLKVRGHWERHETYGLRFRVLAFEETQATSMANQQGVEKLLVRVPGVGKKLAAKLAAKGLRNLIDDPGLVALAVPVKYQERAYDTWVEMRPEAELAALFAEYGLGPGKTRQIFEVCGGVSGVWKVLRQNPWALSTAGLGISFEIADKLAIRLGGHKNSPSRLRAGIAVIAKEEVSRGGHTVLAIDQLAKAAMRKLEVSYDDARNGVLGNENLIQVDPEHVAPSNFHRSEATVATKIQQLTHWAGLELPESLIRETAAERGLDEKQTEALLTLNRAPVGILTGGPGTGKTTTSGAFVEAIQRAGRQLVILAPTGLAARRISQVSGYEAMTIHRWILRRDNLFGRNADLIMIDECSMIDSELMAQLLTAMQGVTKRILMVGDNHQLPPVGAGRPFADLIESELVPVCKLEKIHRQEGDSVIPLVAKSLREGEYPDRGTELARDWPEELKEGLVSADLGFKFYEFDDPADVERVAAREALEQAGRLGQKATVVLSPMYRGKAGITSLGKVLQDALNPLQPGEEQVSGSGGTWRMRDPIMHISNEYEIGLTHAMRGVITGVDAGAERIEIAWEDGITRVHDCPDGTPRQLVLAYALSWHRSQGSEFPAVTITLTRGHEVLLSREALYTALTRAKREVVIVAQKEGAEERTDRDGNASPTGREQPKAVLMALNKRASARRTALKLMFEEMTYP